MQTRLSSLSCCELLQRVGDELVAVAACFGPHIAFQDVEPIELLEAVQEGVFEAASQPHLEGREVRLTLAVAPGSTDRSAAADASTAQLHLVLPPGYPERAAAGVEAVTCSALGRAGAAYSRTLKGWARDLGLGGRLLFCGGRRRRRRSSSSSSDGRSGSKGGSSSSASPPIILILLEGPAPAVKEFVFRLRTRNVDVDSKGRPCRERMMAEIAVQHRQQGGTPPPHDGSCSGAGAGAGGGRQAVGGTAMPAGDAALFGGTFLEEELGVPALAALLAHCGLTQHWRAATGLPGTPPAAGL
ncbi:RWD domain-containing 3 [Micractinium conductrix]|uniref:RWD domain-containing 3 n=1 Tax=Micractinium conductrix TaxID=554055 RepID=A0A2P6VG03_9CHLO|nr:RWD domain-containing 3 [Micractinium conductrix]|eukprot:PSC73020.1 RWD domain-containing 3 [Micractinium conductrix]